jgi:trans-2,3-dihydro-3-hydroxyanthranilate isomerase
VVPRDADSGEARFTLPQLPAMVGEAPDAAATAAALGLDVSEIGGGLPGGQWSAGLPFILVPVKGLAAIARARPQGERFEAAFARGSPGKAFLFCRETVDGGDFHARMFAPGMGIPEDPATGSAIAGLGGLLAAHGGLGDGTHRIRVEQGYEMGRPSQIDMTLTMAGGKLMAGTIGGGAVVVTEGAIEA